MARPLLSHGSEEADWIVAKTFPELGAFELKSDSLAARMFVFEHQDEFRVLVDPKKPEKGLRLCLAAIFERLFFYEGVCSISNRFLLSKEEVLVEYIRSSERAFDERNK